MPIKKQMAQYLKIYSWLEYAVIHGNSILEGFRKTLVDLESSKMDYLSFEYKQVYVGIQLQINDKINRKMSSIEIHQLVSFFLMTNDLDAISDIFERYPELKNEFGDLYIHRLEQLLEVLVSEDNAKIQCVWSFLSDEKKYTLLTSTFEVKFYSRSEDPAMELDIVSLAAMAGCDEVLNFVLDEMQKWVPTMRFQSDLNEDEQICVSTAIKCALIANEFGCANTLMERLPNDNVRQSMLNQLAEIEGKLQNEMGLKVSTVQEWFQNWQGSLSSQSVLPQLS